MKSCFIIAEAGVNHNGSEKLALRLIEAAAQAGADAVKFQSFKAESLVSQGVATAEYQKQQTGYTDQFSMLKKLEISEDLHLKIIDHCKKNGIEFLSTPFDLSAAEYLLKQDMRIIKIPSGEVTNLPFIRSLAAFNKPIILSTGMSSLNEVKEAVEEVRKERARRGFNEHIGEMLTILHCTSNYPARYEDINLNAMNTMAAELNLPVGYSDHTEGTLVSVAAVAIGAKVIEKHFTLDRELPGPDHKASLEPDELKRMVDEIRTIESCLGDGVKKPRPSELPVRDLVRRSVTLVVDKKAGTILEYDDLVLLRPGTGIPPKQLDTVVGKVLKIGLKSGALLSWQDLADA